MSEVSTYRLRAVAFNGILTLIATLRFAADFFFAADLLFGQIPPQSSFKSVEVNPDRTVTVRYRAAGAQKVMFARESAEPVAMTHGEGGVWTLTTAPVDPAYYGYSFIVDDIPQLDPENPSIKPNLISLQNVMYVPDVNPQPWE
jgi:enterochelin esterase family protein